MLMLIRAVGLGCSPSGEVVRNRTGGEQAGGRSGLACRGQQGVVGGPHGGRSDGARRLRAGPPFLDGNGRTGRLLANLVLVRLGYAPAIIQKRERMRYLKALRRADKGAIGPLAEIIARAVLDNLYRFILPAVADPSHVVPLAALETPDVSRIALVNAARRGRLRAQHDDNGQWRSTREWVNEYLGSRGRRRH
ncbi:hypothetical protein [Myceligenerans halotolerans]